VSSQESVLSILVKARDLASATLGRVGKNLDGLDKKIGKLARKGLGNAWRNTERIALGVVGAAAAGIVAAIKTAADFESQMNTINTVAQLAGTATSGALGKIGDSIRKLSRETGTPLEDLTQGYYDLVSAGVSAKDAQNVLTQANTLAIGGLSTTAEAVDLLTTAINSYGGDASKAAQFTNFFAEAIAAGKTTASQLAASFATVGPMAAKAGIGLDQVAAATGRMTAKGTPTAEAMTQIRAAIVALQKPTAKMKALQKDLGVNFAEMARKKGLAYTYNEIENAARKAGIPMVQLTGRIEGAQYAAQVAGSEYAGYVAELDKVHRSSDDAGVAAEQAAKRQDGLNYQLGILKALARDAGITIGSKLLPKLTPLAKGLGEFINTHQGDIGKFGDDLASGLEKAGRYLKDVDWKSLGEGLRIGAGGAKALVDAFLAAPPWLQGFLVTGFAANKFTGGALAAIAGEIGKGVIKGVLGMNAGVVNINAGVVNGGAGGVGGLAGGVAGKGGLRRAVGTGLAVTAAAMSVGELVSTWQEVNAQSTAMGRELQDQLAQGIDVKTPAQLQTALDAVNAGIAQLQSNPLNVLVQGDALSSLQAMKSDLAKRLEAPALVNFRAGERASAAQTPAESLTATLARLQRSRKAATKAGDDRKLDQINRKIDQVRTKLGVARSQEKSASLGKALAPLQGDTRSEGLATRRSIDAQGKALIDLRAGERESAAGTQAKLVNNETAVKAGAAAAVRAAGSTTDAARSAGATAASAMSWAADRIVAAIGALDLVVDVTTVNRTTTVNTAYGPSGSSRNTGPRRE
jgi:TP901 family phage tail tape measure protein